MSFISYVCVYMMHAEIIKIVIFYRKYSSLLPPFILYFISKWFLSYLQNPSVSIFSKSTIPSQAIIISYLNYCKNIPSDLPLFIFPQPPFNHFSTQAHHPPTNILRFLISLRIRSKPITIIKIWPYILSHIILCPLTDWFSFCASSKWGSHLLRSLFSCLEEFPPPLLLLSC